MAGAMVHPGNILALDTTFAACSAAVSLDLPSDGGGRRVWRWEAMATGHAERLMPMIDEVMQEAGVDYDVLEAIAVTEGPGSFTGTRVGIAAARGLALATGLPVLAATSLAVIARSAAAELLAGGEALHRDAPLMVCVDARRGQVYRQDFADGGGRAISAAAIMSLEAAAQTSPAGGPVVAVGSAAEAVADISKAVIAGPVDVLPSARYLPDVELEVRSPVQPLYLRPPDAKAQSGKTIARQDG